MPALAKHDPGPGAVANGQGQTPPGQAKQEPAQQQAPANAQAPAAAPTAEPAQQPAPQADKHVAKQEAKAQRQQSQPAATTTTTSPSHGHQKAQHQANTKLQSSAQRQAARVQAAPTRGRSTGNGNGNGNAAKTGPPASTPAASTPAQATQASAPVATNPVQSSAPSSQASSTGGSFTPAKNRHKAAKHRLTTRTGGTTANNAVSHAVSPVARITPTPLASAGPTSSAKAGKSGAKGGYVPQPTKRDDAPALVFRTVRDAVDVVPVAIWILLGLLTLLASLFAVTSARQTRRAHRLAAERGELLGDVGVLQEAVLPVVPPRVGSLAMSVAHRPAGGPAAGGDFYDVVALDNGRTALVVGDVSGHGPGALGHATLVRFTLRAHLESGSGPREALAIAADSLAPHFDEGFATAAVALHDPEAGTLTYSTAAHEAPIVVGPGAHVPVLASSTPPLGIGAGGPSARRQTTIPFPKGSLACMLTDGALEARVRGELVGRARIEEWVSELGERPAAGDMAELIRSRAAVSDDLAVCFATSTAGEDSGNWRVEELYRPTPEEAERFLDACGADAEHKRAVAESLRFPREDTILSVRFENGAVISAEIVRAGNSKPVAA